MNGLRASARRMVWVALAVTAITIVVAGCSKSDIGVTATDATRGGIGSTSLAFEAVSGATEAQLDAVVGILRLRLDALGATRADIARTGSTITVRFGGMDDPERVADVLSSNGAVSFRPVLATLPPAATDGAPASTTVGGDATTSSGAVSADELSRLQQQVVEQQGAAPAPPGCPTAVTPPERDQPTENVLLPQLVKGQQVSRLCLGPAALTGSGVEKALATTEANDRWVVLPTFKGGSEGIDAFNALAAACYAGKPTCPPQSGQQHGQVAIVFDGRVVSAPEIQTPMFRADQVQISGNFTEREAKDLALLLSSGALPVTLRRAGS